MRTHALAFEQAVADGDIPAWGKANHRFHVALYSPAQRPRTLEIVGRLHAQCDRFVRLQLTLTHGMQRAIREHRAILAAAKSRDAVRLTRLVRDHILQAGQGLTETLEQHRHHEVTV
jgi:DNA-binding GntR family transcriptional regulator